MKKIRQLILFLVDIALAFLALLLTVFIGFWENFSYRIFKLHIIPFLILYAAWFCLLYIFGLYDLDIKAELLKRTGQCLLICLGIGLAFFYLIPLFGITPKTNLLINIFFFGGLIFVWRKIFYLLFSSLYLQNIAFLGKNPIALKLIEEIKSQPQLGYKFIGFLNENQPIESQLEKVRILVVAEKLSPKLTKKLYKALSSEVAFLDLAQAYATLLHKIPIDFVEEDWFLKNLNHKGKMYDKAKRGSDVILALMLMILTSPIWLLTALAIKIEDRGPVFYTQKRVGKAGNLFKMWKFRSMVPQAEKKGVQWAKEKDERRTKVGKIIRRLHIDEFPQMINVLKGDISCVGPRPERPEFVQELEKEIPHYQLRHLIKPGFTGWAQTRYIKYARSKEDSHEKFQYDLYYIKNRSLLLDSTILLKTFLLFFKKG